MGRGAGRRGAGLSPGSARWAASGGCYWMTRLRGLSDAKRGGDSWGKVFLSGDGNCLQRVKIWLISCESGLVLILC